MFISDHVLIKKYFHGYFTSGDNYKFCCSIQTTTNIWLFLDFEIVLRNNYQWMFGHFKNLSQNSFVQPKWCLRDKNNLNVTKIFFSFFLTQILAILVTSFINEWNNIWTPKGLQPWIHWHFRIIWELRRSLFKPLVDSIDADM